MDISYSFFPDNQHERDSAPQEPVDKLKAQLRSHSAKLTWDEAGDQVHAMATHLRDTLEDMGYLEVMVCYVAIPPSPSNIKKYNKDPGSVSFINGYVGPSDSQLEVRDLGYRLSSITSHVLGYTEEDEEE